MIQEYFERNSCPAKHGIRTAQYIRIGENHTVAFGIGHDNSRLPALSNMLLTWRGDYTEARQGDRSKRFLQGASAVGSSRELPLQFIADSHEFVSFGDDAVLFGEKQ